MAMRRIDACPRLDARAGSTVLPLTMEVLMDDAAIRRALLRQFEDGRDLDDTHELYHDDAILEFPQSGERFVGKANFLTWRKQYPAKVDYRVRRMTGHGELWVLEIVVAYNGGAPMLGLSMVQFRGDKIARESIYVMEGFDAPDWRAGWATRFDPLGSVPPSEWREGTEFGLEAVASQ
jgi:hypothetical protein